MVISRRAIVRLSILALAASTSALGVTGGLAAASSPRSAKSLGRLLLPADTVKQAGFAKLVERTATTNQTGDMTCPHGAQEAFKDARGKTGVVVEVVSCTSTQSATTELGGVNNATAPSGARAPRRLGPSALERTSGGSTYTIYWQRGADIGFVSLTTDIVASKRATPGSIGSAPPISRSEQTTLSALALQQDARMSQRNVTHKR